MADKWRIEKRSHLNVDSQTPSLKAPFWAVYNSLQYRYWSVVADFL